MKNNRSVRDLFLILGFLTLLLFAGFSLHGDITFQLYDTYFVVSPFTITILLMAPIWIIVFTRRCIIQQFGSAYDILGLFVALLIFGWVLSPMVSYLLNGT